MNIYLFYSKLSKEWRLLSKEWKLFIYFCSYYIIYSVFFAPMFGRIAGAISVTIGGMLAIIIVIALSFGFGDE